MFWRVFSSLRREKQRDGQFDDIVIGEDVTAKSLKDTLEGRKIVELKRRGKQMWFVLDK